LSQCRDMMVLPTATEEDTVGYYSTAEGTIRFTPALTKELAAEAIDFVDNTVPYAYWVGEHLNIADELGDGDEWNAWFEGKLYTLDRELAVLTEFLHRKGVAMVGTIVGSGEDPADIWRIVIKDGKAVKEMAEIRWPDGTKADVY
jgi:hypothetical protein